MSKIGVLELQGNYDLHHRIFSDLGIRSVGIKTAKDLDNIDGLIIPGGESTTISLLLDSFDLRTPIKNFAKDNPILGTCAGLIMMSKSIKGEKKVIPLEILDIAVDRNAYGRQIMSSKKSISFKLKNQKIPSGVIFNDFLMLLSLFSTCFHFLVAAASAFPCCFRVCPQ